MYHDKIWLREQFIDNKRTPKDIAEECGVGQRLYANG
ncbi:hypothetical protein LCGC14_1631410 [marine sediment metagenome]|uniref:Uncharacterized protein n=1 Tax=marine sediment metagenome TaxID=412755 RepID=A0A0F9I2I6_9ZZZZ